MSTSTQLDVRRFRDVLGHYASGITIVAAHDGFEPIGFTCQSFYSVSVEPPLISFSVMKTSTTYPKIRPLKRFSINVLADNQSHVSGQFARSGTDKWAGIEWSRSAGGNPIIDDTLMWLDCELWAEHDAGDHLIVIGEVKELCPEGWHEGDPLVFYKGHYRHLAGH